MEFKELKKLLQQPYRTANWRNLLSHVFDYVEFRHSPIIIPTDDNRIKELKQYGTVRLTDGKNLALFELTLNDNVNLIRNRVGLNELVKKYIDQDSFHGILSVFEQGKEDYRFTFTARNTEFDEDQGFIDKDTDTKRFTYILGVNESCRTAAERFDALSKVATKDMKAVEDAFNVEKLSELFFKEYIQQFDILVGYLKSKPAFYQAIFEKDETATRNFVKRFLGRLVFLKFIQKKGWLGVPVSEKGWENGNYQFLEEQFKNFENKGLFVSQFLNPMFYEALNVGDRPNDEFQNRGYKIPFLSGGLFENGNPNENRIDFEETELTNLFDFFDRYNFTIDENDLHDKEVGIDPEMLGHIFENLLEDNKDKGAFYTPKEIVRYMCQESLKEYLKTYLEEQQLWPKDEEAKQSLTKTIAAFVEKKETSAILRYDKELATALRDVKICDPAIGSGAFPMGMLNEIFTMTKNLHDESPDRVGAVWKMEGKKWQPNIVKQNIIQKSIYGVDIEPGAVDIARLRFWLTLVIEENEPKPLPHLDYKIVVGNSLVSKLEDTIIDIEWDLKPQLVQADIFGNEGKVTQKRELIREITTLQKQVFEPDSDEAKLSIAIRNKKIDLLVLQLEIMINEKGVTDNPQGTGRNITAMTQKWLETKGWKKQISKLKTMKQGTQTPLEFFDWLLDFPEVMNPEVNKNPGFDIVIGNPPYFIVFDEIVKHQLEEYYKSFKRNNDIYIAFFEFAISLLKRNKGILSFITPNTFLNGDYFKAFRLFINKNIQIKEIRDFKNSKVFQDPTVFVSISTFKSNTLDTKLPYTFNLKVPNDEKSEEIFQIIIASEDDTPFKKRNLVLEKIFKNKDIIVLDDYFYVKDVGFNYWSKGRGKKRNNSSIGSRVFYSGIKKNENDIPFIKGRDIDFYHINIPSNYLIFDYEKKLNENDTFRFSENFLKISPKIVYRQTSNQIIAALDKNGFLNDKTVHIIVPKETDFKINLIGVLGLINSSLFEYLYRYISQESKGRAFAQVKTTYIKKLTIIKNIPVKFVKLIEEIIESNSPEKYNTIKSDEINNSVYKLYNLTYEEALIVEPELVQS